MRSGIPSSSGPQVQLCARCGAQWPVHGQPIQWCPRCHGVLLAPARRDTPARARNYRWVVRKPEEQRRARVTRSATPTPRYAQTPQWGLIDPPPLQQTTSRTPLAYFADRVEPLLIVTAMLFVLAAVAEGFRYGVLLRNRGHLIEQWVLTCSDAAVWSTAVMSLLAALFAALGAVGWLIRARTDEYDSRGRHDPRATPTLVAGCLIPLLNLIAPGVFLTELAQHRPHRQRLAVRIWWCTWVLGAAMAVGAIAWRSADSLQAKADGVIFTAVTDLVAAGVALVSLWTIFALEGRDMRGRARRLKRWLAATGPHRPIIEPIRGAVDRTEHEPIAEPSDAAEDDADAACSEPIGLASDADDRVKVSAE
jgi:hypothetical protein